LEIKSDYGLAMQKTTRPYWLWFYIAQVLLPGVILAGCGGEESAPQSRSAAVAAAVGRSDRGGQAGRAAQEPISQNGKAPSENKNDTAISSTEELTSLSKLRALPLLAPLSNKEIAELLRHTRPLSSSGRLGIIDNHSALVTLTNQQKQQLLNQIENIVPITIPAMLVICECSNDIQRRLCVRESCSDRSEIRSLCNQACGTLAAFGSQCMAAKQC
jgi:hypothetical protein